MKAKQIIKQLQDEYPQLTFLVDNIFLFRPEQQQIFYVPEDDAIFLIHELSHALLHHYDYKFDIELLKIESGAWDLTKDLAAKYHIPISDELLSDAMDSYRNWLDARSRCPKCNSVGFQDKLGRYHCLECHTKWLPNIAKQNSLRRKLIK